MIVLPRTSTFEGWLKEKQQHGLEIIGWNTAVWPPAAYVRATSGEQIVFEGEIISPANEANGANMANKEIKTGLAKILDDLHCQALAHSGQTQRHTLKGGLRIDVIVGIDGETRILLARQGVSYPSDTEWAVTLNHFPYDPPLEAQPERFDWRGWRCLRAGWKTPVETKGAANG